MQKKSQQKLAKMFLIYTQLMTTAKCLILITSSIQGTLSRLMNRLFTSVDQLSSWLVDCAPDLDE